MTTELAVIALGGNAILRSRQRGTFEEQSRNVERTARHVADLLEQGYRIVVTHGNGPQVGATLLRHDAAKRIVPPMTLDVCVAETQGFIGYMIQQALRNELNKRNIDSQVVTVITRVTVKTDDEAFKHPTKPVGPFYSRMELQKVQRSHPQFLFKRETGRGWRSVVPSPEPETIAESDAIRALVDSGFIVVACGGGGIPIVEEQGQARGVRAVIDKDLASERLATFIRADYFLMLTDVDGAFFNYGTPKQRLITRATPKELLRWYRKGHFRQGSMGPKVLAAARFVQNGGREAIIARLDKLATALQKATGTHVVPG